MSGGVSLGQVVGLAVNPRHAFGVLVADPRFKDRYGPGKTLACLKILGSLNQLCLEQLMDQFRVVQPGLIAEQVLVERTPFSPVEVQTDKLHAAIR